MNDPKLNNLLKWSIENSDVSRNDPDAPKNPNSRLDPEALQQVFESMRPPNNYEVMLKCMDIIKDPEASLQDKIIAFENFEVLIESIDNANNMENGELWTNLVKQLENDEAELRMYAASCAGTAVENNPRAQQRLLVLGAIPTLVKLATEDKDQNVRKKAIRALSCASRNFQPALDILVANVPTQYKPKAQLDAGNMEAVDSIIHPLRADAGRTH